MKRKIFSYYFIILFTTVSLHLNAQVASVKKVWTLRECIDQALENNLNLQQSKLSVTDQEILLKRSKADLFPSLNAGGNFGYNWGRGIDPTTNLFISQRVGYTGFSLQSGAVIYNGFQKQNTIKQSQVDLDAARKDLEYDINTVSLNVVSLYLNVIFNKELLVNSQTQLESTQRQLDRTSVLVESGSLPRADLLNLQSQLATNESNVIAAENNLNFSLLNLKQALLVPVEEEFDIEIPDIDVMEENLAMLNLASIYEQAENTQPDIQSADLNVESATYGEKIARGAAMPQFSVSASVRSNYSDANDNVRPIIDGTVDQVVQVGYVQGTNEPVLDNVTVPNVVGTDENYSLTEQFGDNLNQQLAFQLSIPIFNGLSTSTNIQRSKIQRQRAEINARQLRQNLRQIIEQSYNDALAASKNYQASLKQVQALEESFRVATEQYKLGALNFVDYQISENNLFQARSDLVRNKYDFIFKTKILDFYQGKTLTF